MIKKLFCSLMIGCSVLEGTIQEINTIESVKDHLTENSVVFLNVGDTLFAPSSMLADYQWREYFVTRANAAAKNPETAEAAINYVKGIIVEKIPKITPEKITPSFIGNLQENQVPVLGYTQRFFSTAYAENNGLITSNHLTGMGIFLENTLSYYSAPEFQSSDLVFKYGMLFTNKNPVASSLKAFFARNEQTPSLVILVDDDIAVLQEVEAELAAMKIEFIGLRYGIIDANKKAFDADIGTIQFFAYIFENKLMTNEEAKEIKKSTPDTDYQALLDEWIFSLYNPPLPNSPCGNKTEALGSGIS